MQTIGFLLDRAQASVTTGSNVVLTFRRPAVAEASTPTSGAAAHARAVAYAARKAATPPSLGPRRASAPLSAVQLLSTTPVSLPPSPMDSQYVVKCGW